MHAVTGTVELVRRAQAGDRVALETLLARYYERVRRAVRVWIGPRLRRELDTGDILQQTFVKAVDRLNGFEMRDESSLVHWLVKIAQGQIHDAVKSITADKRDVDRRVGLEVKGDDGKTTPLGRELTAQGQAAADAAATSESHAQLELALDALPENYRDCIVLRDFEGLPWNDVAQQTGRPSAAAARMMHRQAMLALTKELIRVRVDWQRRA